MRGSSGLHRAYFTLVIGSCLTILVADAASVWAYSEATHTLIVTDAVEFVLAQGGSYTRYGDGSSGRADLELLWLALRGGKDQEGIRASARELGQASADTDSAQDVWLRFPGLLWDAYAPSKASVSFTTFSHFLNVQTPGVLWPFGGYYFGWVDTNQVCSDAGVEDLVANFFIANSRATLDTVKSDASVRYRDPLGPGNDEGTYLKHIGQQIRHVHFWPLSNLAQYWFKRFVASPVGNDKRPFNLPWLGPVLHVTSDATVPYHAAGLSGCGHGVYEDGVERWYRDKRLYEAAEVKRLLETAPHLRSNLPLREILLGNARYAADSRFCTCKLNSCDCPVARNEKAAKELVNLAVASTVTVLRKALSEWIDEQRYEPPVSGKAVDSGRNALQLPTYTSVSQIPIDRADIMSFEAPAGFEQQFLGEISQLRLLVTQLEARSVPAQGFRGAFDARVSGLAGLLARFPNVNWNPYPSLRGPTPYPGMPSVAPERIRFRLPTSEELASPRTWERYRLQRRRFLETYGLYENGLIRAAVEGKLRAGLSEDVKKIMEQYWQDLRRVQELYIDSLTREGSGR